MREELKGDVTGVSAIGFVRKRRWNPVEISGSNRDCHRRFRKRFESAGGAGNAGPQALRQFDRRRAPGGTGMEIWDGADVFWVAAGRRGMASDVR